MPPQAQVLLVSHPWESPGNPDPSGKQFLALRRFLEEARAGAGGTKGNDDNNDGGAMGRGFGYVWASFSCTSSNRMKPMFATHVHNILTVRLSFFFCFLLFFFASSLRKETLCLVCVHTPTELAILAGRYLVFDLFSDNFKKVVYVLLFFNPSGSAFRFRSVVFGLRPPVKRSMH